MYSRFRTRRHELTTTSVDPRDINPQDSERRPSKASLVLGTVATAVELQDIRPTSGHFNPRSRRYKLCCCAHVKTFTIASGIIEIFIVCFLVVAVLPDLSSKLCMPSKEDVAIEELLGTENITLEGNPFQFVTINSTNTTLILSNIGLDTIQQVSCSVGIGWFFWAFVHIIAVNIFFYGCKNNKWKLLIPHLLLRFALILGFILIISILIIVLLNPMTDPDVKPALIILMCAAGIFALLLGVLVAIEIRCCEFVKKSAETGFSTTIARSMGAPTISLNEDRSNHLQALQLPSMPLPIIEHQDEIMKFDEDSQPITLPSVSPSPQNSQSAQRRRSSAFSENPLHLRNLPPLRHTYYHPG